MTIENNSRQLSLLLLQESIWGIEDKINVFIESLADHEAEIIRLKRLNDNVLERIGKLEARRLTERREAE